jgi:hypothetical protein
MHLLLPLHHPPPAFAALASVLEGLGVSAYLAAAAAASILDKVPPHRRSAPQLLPARRAPGIPVPSPPFDTPLGFNDVYTLAAPFVVSCPAADPQLPPLKAFPVLTLGTSGAIKSGDSITLLTEGYVLQGTPLYGAFITITGPIFVVATAVEGGFSLVVPEGDNGQVCVVLTGCNKVVSDDTVAAGPAIVEVTNL